MGHRTRGEVVLIRPAPAPGIRGPRSFGLEEFDPFWEKVVENDILVAMHSSDSGYERYANDWMGNNSEMLPFQPQAFRMLQGWRPVEDAVSALVCHGALSRFPALKVAVIENGSSWVEPLLKNMADIYKKMPQEFLEDPVMVVKRNVYISPFWEEDLGALAELIGEEHVLFGSDYPHPEGLADPVSYVDELEGLSEEKIRKIMGGNLARLMNVEDAVFGEPARPAWRSIPEISAAAAEPFGAHLAVEDGPTRLTYAELFQEARTFGPPWSRRASNRATGWPSGPSTAPSGSLPAGPLHGRGRAGAHQHPLQGRARRPTPAADRSQVLVTVTEFLGTDYVAMLRATEVELPELRHHRRGPGRRLRTDAESWAAFLGRATEAARAEVDRRWPRLAPDDLSDILFTSGTTGQPKGVLMTHGRTLCVATDWVAMTGLSADDRYLMVNPYFHMFGLKAGILACVASGATMLPEAVFDIDRILAGSATKA